jgi:HPt (histidine-containing phosphotransfer) domain-containing protein
MNPGNPESGGAKPLVDLDQLQSACDGDADLLRELMSLYFNQADEIMAGLCNAIATEDVGEVDHLAHKLAGSCLACGMSAVVPSVRQLEHNAKAGHLQGAPEFYADAVAQLAAVRQYMDNYLQNYPPQ